MRLPLLQFTVPQLYGLDDYPNRVVVWPPPGLLFLELPRSLWVWPISTRPTPKPHPQAIFSRGA